MKRTVCEIAWEYSDSDWIAKRPDGTTYKAVAMQTGAGATVGYTLWKMDPTEPRYGARSVYDTTAFGRKYSVSGTLKFLSRWIRKTEWRAGNG